jgi:tetraprenyl-beta-curcumene synthase
MAATSRIQLAIFVRAACRYWLSVFPRVCAETHRWRCHAEAIPDPVLRRAALHAQAVKRGNVEGAAAFAAFAPSCHQASVVRAQVAFQMTYDYVDTLAEQANVSQPIRNGRQLHSALLAALDDGTRHPDYYAFCPRSDDAGYLWALVEACREALRQLPSRTAILGSARRMTARIVAYQSLNLSESQGGHSALARWAVSETPLGSELRWWEVAASAGSSLGVFALLSAAARACLSVSEAQAIENAYWPDIGAFHSLLDSLVDKAEDEAAGQYNLLDYYATPREAAQRLRCLAREGLRAVTALADGDDHALILVGMASHYLTAPEASTPTGRSVAREIRHVTKGIAAPATIIFKMRRAVER